MNRECVGCIKRKTPYCPPSIECMTTEDMPYYQNRIMLLKENKQLKDNWNKLKEYIVENNKTLCWTNNYDNILGKMEELQGSDSND